MYIYEGEQTRIGVDFTEFYQRIMLYGTAKYILSKLLFCKHITDDLKVLGKFKINYLIGKYDERFIDKLNSSRFCAFAELFNDYENPVYGYKRYYK